MILFLSIAIPSMAVGVGLGLWLGVLLTSTAFEKQVEEHPSTPPRSIDEPDLFDTDWRSPDGGFGTRARFDFGASSDYPFPPRPTSSFDGEGQHASSAPLFLQRPGV